MQIFYTIFFFERWRCTLINVWIRVVEWSANKMGINKKSQKMSVNFQFRYFVKQFYHHPSLACLCIRACVYYYYIHVSPRLLKSSATKWTPPGPVPAMLPTYMLVARAWALSRKSAEHSPPQSFSSCACALSKKNMRENTLHLSLKRFIIQPFDNMTVRLNFVSLCRERGQGSGQHIPTFLRIVQG